MQSEGSCTQHNDNKRRNLVSRCWVHFQNRRGQSLVSVMMAIGATGIVMLGLMSMQSLQEKANLNSKILMSRNMLQLWIERFLIDPDSLSKTLADTTVPGNVSLNDCQKSPPNCVAVTKQGFSLFDGAGVIITGAGSASPVRYDTDGAPCGPTASSRCVFEVFTTYTATCPGGISPCTNPNVSTQYTIQPAPGVTSGGGVSLRSVSSQDVLLTVVPPTSVNLAVGLCAVGQVVSGLDATGNPICTTDDTCAPTGYPTSRGLVVADLNGNKCCAFPYRGGLNQSNTDYFIYCPAIVP